MPEQWQNWSGNVRAAPRRIVAPKSDEEISTAVREAAASGEVVRVVGTGHSFVPIAATDGCLIQLDADTGFESFDTGALTATVRAGTKMHDLGEPLLERGMALRNMGDIDRQSVAGAASTGTHGTGRTLRTLADALTGLRLIDARGARIECSAQVEPRLFEFARVSLGALGVLSAARIALVPAYRLHERVWREDCEACLETLGEKIERNRHFEFFWYPASDGCDQKSLNPTEREPRAQGDAPGERIGWSHRIIPSQREIKFFEMEYSVPAERGVECFREIRGMLRARHPDVVWPVEYRTLRADDIPLSMAYQRETVSISVHRDGRLPYADVMNDAEAVFRNHQGRPHWGKLHSLTHRELSSLYPRFEEFCVLRRELDPDGVFLSPYLRTLFEES